MLIWFTHKWGRERVIGQKESDRGTKGRGEGGRDFQLDHGLPPKQPPLLFFCAFQKLIRLVPHQLRSPSVALCAQKHVCAVATTNTAETPLHMAASNGRDCTVVSTAESVTLVFAVKEEPPKDFSVKRSQSALCLCDRWCDHKLFMQASQRSC